MNKEELTAEKIVEKYPNIYNSSLSKQVIEIIEHYHEIKSKDLRKELDLTEEDLARWINKAADCAKDLIASQARIKELEDKSKRLLSELNQSGIIEPSSLCEVIEDFQQTLKTK